MSETKQIIFELPQEKNMREIKIETGAYQGRWQVDTELLKTTDGIFVPHNESIDAIQTYYRIMNDKLFVDNDLIIPPVSVLIAGIQHSDEFREALRNTNQLTGSVIDGRTWKYSMGSPKIRKYARKGVEFRGFAEDGPVMSIKPQSGLVNGLSITSFWGTSKENISE